MEVYKKHWAWSNSQQCPRMVLDQNEAEKQSKPPVRWLKVIHSKWNPGMRRWKPPWLKPSGSAAYCCYPVDTSAASPIMPGEAIKIPSCHKKPLGRVEEGRQQAHMKRSPARLTDGVCAGLSASLKRVRQKKNGLTDQEALHFYSLHFHWDGHLSKSSAVFSNLERRSEKWLKHEWSRQ